MPAGADIFVDDTDTLWHTDSLITGIESGTHTITAYKDGYQPESADVTIRMGEQSEISFVFGGNKTDAYSPASSGMGDGKPDPPLPSETEVTKEKIGEDMPEADGGIVGYIFDIFAGIFSGAPEASDSLPVVTTNASAPVAPPEATVAGPDPSGYDALPDETTENSGINDAEAGTGGGLYVTSYPDNLPITLDGGVKTDKKTPQYFCGLKDGFHKVMVSMVSDSSEPAKMAQKTVRVFSGGDDSRIKLEPGVFSPKVSVTVQSKDFRDCVFMIEGESPEYTFPSTVSVEKSGTYLTVVKDGTFYTFNAGHQEENSVLNIQCPNAKENTGTISITSSPAGAAVSVDGYRTDLITPPCTVDNVTEGNHILKVSKGGYYPEEKEIRFVNTGQSDNSDFSFVLKEYPYGSLRIDSTPSDSMIYLKGRYTGVTTPHEFEYLPIGSYDVAVVYNRTVYKEDIVTVAPLDKSGVTLYNVTLEM